MLYTSTSIHLLNSDLRLSLGSRCCWSLSLPLLYKGLLHVVLLYYCPIRKKILEARKSVNCQIKCTNNWWYAFLKIQWFCAKFLSRLAVSLFFSAQIFLTADCVLPPDWLLTLPVFLLRAWSPYRMHSACQSYKNFCFHSVMLGFYEGLNF